MHRARLVSLDESILSVRMVGRAVKSASALAFAALAFVLDAQAAVAPEEATALGTTLTGIGAERAGNASGSIPNHAGGRLTPPAGYRPGDSRRIDPFADEKPLRVLTGSSIGEAASQLTAGTRELLRRHATFRVDVYPTHRTVTYPEYLIENARRNATAARTTEGGLGLENARPGVPFPLPKDGSEVMWNHRLRFLGRAIAFKYDNWLVGPSGQRTLMGTAQSVEEYPAFDAKRDSTLQEGEPWFKWKLEFSAPQRRAGEATLIIDAVNPLRQARRVWSYVPGQRRVKLAEVPEEALNGGSSGTYTNDDIFVYSGALDRFDVKLLGKREMLVPYNTYRLSYHANVDAVLQPGHINPDLLRWELHRVWVVEATLKPGQRHVYGRRVFYVDEDSWTALASDGYDVNGQLLRGVFAFLSYSYDAGVPYSDNHAAYDFSTGSYFMAYFAGPHFGVRYVEPLPSSQWSPDALAGAGVR
jgi:hypothetical protein